METTFRLIEQFLVNYGLLAVFLVGLFEEIFFPIPSSLTFLAAGFFLVKPTLFWGTALFVIAKIAFWGTLGITIGSFFIYGIFYWGGKTTVDKYGKYLAISWKDFDNLEKKFAKGRGDELIFFLLRASPIWSMTLISAFAGVIRWPWKKFSLYTFLGTLIRLLILVFLGWNFGEAYRQLGQRFEGVQFYGTIILVVLSLGLFYYFLKKQKKD